AFSGKPGSLGEFGAHGLFPPVDDEADVWAPLGDQLERRHDHAWTVVAAHGIDGNRYQAAVISLLTSGRRARRENSGFARPHNGFSVTLWSFRVFPAGT